MIRGLLILLLCQFAGEIVARAAGIPVPGGVIGMLILFAALVIRRHVPADLDQVSQVVLKPLTLYFVPASVGIITMGPLLAQEGLRIGLVMVLSTLTPLLLCGYGLDRWLRSRDVA
ncbi:MAG TPA: CidA/LrgA family protein [Moraxellaceae bacterium]|jgi:holin-like protein|nr:CidA/LrgA family protein [Moraxellaceae bacterium]